MREGDFRTVSGYRIGKELLSASEPPTAFFVANGMMTDRKSTRLNSSHADIYTLSLHDALPIYAGRGFPDRQRLPDWKRTSVGLRAAHGILCRQRHDDRSEEHTSELQSRRYLHSFPTRRSSDLCGKGISGPSAATGLEKNFCRPPSRPRHSLSPTA